MTTTSSAEVPATALLIAHDTPCTAAELRPGGLFVLLAALFLAVMDLSAANVAIPTIAGQLHLGPASQELVVAGYGVPYALLLVVGGRLGDGFGRRRTMLAGVAGFALASIGCAAAGTAWQLIAARIVQGGAAAVMVPQLLATIQAATSGPRRAAAIARYGATAGLALVAGQLAGGLFTSYDVLGLGWRAVFALNVPAAAVILLAAPRLLPESRGVRVPVDLPGTLWFATAVLALLVPVTLGQAEGWPWWSLALLASVGPATAMLVRAERRAERASLAPLLPLPLLRAPVARAGLVIAAVFFLCFSGFLFSYAEAMQRDLHHSAAATGLALTPFGLAFLLTSLATTRSRQPGPRLMRWGAAIQAAAVGVTLLVVALRWPGLAPAELMPSFALTGVAQGLVVAPLFRTVLAGVPARWAGAGSGVLNTTQQLAIGLGAAIFGDVQLQLAGGGHAGAGFAAVLAAQLAGALIVVRLTGRLAGTP